MSNLDVLSRRLTTIKEINDELQNLHPVGSPKWHRHESLDDALHDAFAKVEVLQEDELAGKEKLGETCMDGGTCHHHCSDQCFRRECCVPLSESIAAGLTMEQWRLQPKHNGMMHDMLVMARNRLRGLMENDDRHAWKEGFRALGKIDKVLADIELAIKEIEATPGAHWAAQVSPQELAEIRKKFFDKHNRQPLTDDPDFYNAIAANAVLKMIAQVISNPLLLSTLPIPPLPPALTAVIAERHRQVSMGYDAEHDDAHVSGEIAAMAAVYLMPDACRTWDASSTGYGATLAEALIPADWTVPKFGTRREQLVKGIAMAVAELEREDRAAKG